MRQYLKYVFLGLILMAPQEFIVNIFRGTTFPLNLMSLVGWAVMLSAMYGVFRIARRFLKNDARALALLFLLGMGLGLVIEWSIIGNSPWKNPDANQLGLVAGWTSVFILPHAFLEQNARNIRKWTMIWYPIFALSLLIPIVLIPDRGPVIGVTIYGFSVVPFLVLAIWYVFQKWRSDYGKTKLTG